MAQNSKGTKGLTVEAPPNPAQLPSQQFLEDPSVSCVYFQKYATQYISLFFFIQMVPQ